MWPTKKSANAVPGADQVELQAPVVARVTGGVPISGVPGQVGAFDALPRGATRHRGRAGNPQIVGLRAGTLPSMRQMIQKLHKAQSVAASVIASSAPQNFLGARWVSGLVRYAPSSVRTSVALRLVSLSPHYFFTQDLHAEDARCRTQREGLTDQLLAPFLNLDTVALDYGCGPGYMALAVARRVRHVEAVDISRGVLSCAGVLNAASNITYETPEEAGSRTELVDLAYSFAVVQHLTDETFRAVLSMLKRRIRPGGSLILHFALPIDGWRTEDQWKADSSVQGRAKLRFGLNCFGRGIDHVEAMVTEAGFSDVRIEPLAGKTDADSAIAAQYWLVAST